MSPSRIAQLVVVQSEATEGQPPQKQNTKVDAKGQAIYVGKIREAAKNVSAPCREADRNSFDPSATGFAPKRL